MLVLHQERVIEESLAEEHVVEYGTRNRDDRRRHTVLSFGKRKKAVECTTCLSNKDTPTTAQHQGC